MNKFLKILSYIFLIIVAFISVFPLYWMVSASTNKSVDVIRGKLLPGTELIENIKNLTSRHNVWRALFNSFKYSVVLTVLSLIVCSLAGYGFEIYHDKVKDRVMGILLMAMMVPFVSIMIPLYRMFSKMGLLNTTLGFILPTISTPFLIMMFRQSSRNFPTEMLDAARIDGLSEIQLFTRIYIPTMKPTYAAAMTVTFMNAWNNYLWPKVVMTNQDSMTMPMIVANLREGYVTDYGVLMVSVLISTVPTIVLFFVLQKSFREGITGTVK